MDVSSSTAANASSEQQVVVLKKALDNESQIAEKLIEGATSSSPAGVGAKLNVYA